MTKEDMKDLLLGKAIRYLENKNFKYWELIEKINLIVESNIQYESYDMYTMQRELYKYVKGLKGE